MQQRNTILAIIAAGVLAGIVTAVLMIAIPAALRPGPLSRLAPGTEVVVTGLPPEGETTLSVGYNDGACAVHRGARGVVISDTFGEDRDSEVRRQVMVRFDRDDLKVYVSREGGPGYVPLPPGHPPRSVIVAPDRGDLTPIR